jgi:hypothetical protein
MADVAEPRRTLSEADVWSVDSHATPVAVYWRQVVDLGGRLRILLDHNAPPWLYTVLGRIQCLMALRPNWDSYGSRSIDANAVSYALEFLRTSMPQEGKAPQIVPTSKGGLQLEWHANGIDLEVEVDPVGDVSLSFDKDDRSEEQTGSALATETLEPYVASASA